MKLQRNQENAEGAAVRWLEALVKLLNENFELLKSKNKYYSVRRYAQGLGVSVGALSEVMRGKRGLSQKRAKQILDKLKVKPEQRFRILVLMGENIDFSEIGESSSNESETNNELETSWDPEKELVETHFSLCGIEVTPSLIARRLDISVENVEKIIKDCLISGGLVKDEKGSFVKNQTEDLFLTQMGFASDKNFKKKQRASLELAQKALEVSNLESADFISFTFAGSNEDIALFKKELRQILYKMFLFSNSSKKDQVIRISSQIFPVDLGGNFKG